MEMLLTYRGKRITERDVTFIREMIAQHPTDSRRVLSQRLCQAWDWRQPNGALRDMVCRGLMLMLCRAGYIELPARRKNPLNPLADRNKPPPVEIDPHPLQGSLSLVLPLEIRQVRRTDLEKLCDGLIEQYHYLGYCQPVGEHLKHVVFAHQRPIVMFYSVLIVLGGASPGNVFSSLGAGREVKLLLADELPFILACLVPVIRAGYKLDFGSILAYQGERGMLVGSVSGAVAFVVALLAVQAKMALPPFHIPDAETELVAGPLMEYGGPLLAFWKLNQFMMLVVFPFLLILLFWGGFPLSGLGLLWGVLKYLLILVLIIILKNTNPRVRTDTAIAFFWKYLSPLALARRRPGRLGDRFAA